MSTALTERCRSHRAVRLLARAAMLSRPPGPPVHLEQAVAAVAAQVERGELDLRDILTVLAEREAGTRLGTFFSAAIGAGQGKAEFSMNGVTYSLDPAVAARLGRALLDAAEAAVAGRFLPLVAVDSATTADR